MKRLFIILGTLICLFSGNKLFAQTDSLAVLDKGIFNRYRAIFKEKENLPVPQLMIETARFFLGTPYVASTLEKEPEQLVVNLRELDCTTFAEVVLALVRTVKSEKNSFENFEDNLKAIRYRDAVIEDYSSRLHYMADWIFNNQRKGIVEDINKSIGGSRFPMNLHFISAHPDSYKQLKDDDEMTRKMKQIEQSINTRNYYYIPKSEIENNKRKIQNGDIICFATSIKGLDVTHVGIAYWKSSDILTFIHASSSKKKVIIEQRSLADYASRIESNVGIILARPIE